MADEQITFANEPEGMEAFALRDTSSPKLCKDAWLAAFALCSGFQLITTDKAFSRFNGLNLRVVKAEKS
jgi:uncharacterized protein